MIMIMNYIVLRNRVGTEEPSSASPWMSSLTALFIDLSTVLKEKRRTDSILYSGLVIFVVFGNGDDGGRMRDLPVILLTETRCVPMRLSYKHVHSRSEATFKKSQESQRFLAKFVHSRMLVL